MGQFDPSTREINLITGQFLEAAKLQGTSVRVKLVDSAERDLYKDPDYKFKIVKDLDIILDEQPTRNILETYGWYNEHDEQMPLIAYISKHDDQGKLVRPTVGSMVIIPYTLAEDTILERRYIVSDAKLTNPGSWMWICKLTPYRKDFENERDPEEDYDDNFDFINFP